MFSSFRRRCLPKVMPFAVQGLAFVPAFAAPHHTMKEEAGRPHPKNIQYLASFHHLILLPLEFCSNYGIEWIAVARLRSFQSCLSFHYRPMLQFSIPPPLKRDRIIKRIHAIDIFPTLPPLHLHESLFPQIATHFQTHWRVCFWWLACRPAPYQQLRSAHLIDAAPHPDKHNRQGTPNSTNEVERILETRRAPTPISQSMIPAQSSWLASVAAAAVAAHCRPPLKTILASSTPPSKLPCRGNIASIKEVSWDNV
mmetsp:Transcript_10691/g.23666  ORF Transcript_10691/g.23666 Transcript_10691/m.23666 type:complete len:254 (+) Transcript_10691:2501-3262(+)